MVYKGTKIGLMIVSIVFAASTWSGFATNRSDMSHDKGQKCYEKKLLCGADSSGRITYENKYPILKELNGYFDAANRQDWSLSEKLLKVAIKKHPDSPLIPSLLNNLGYIQEKEGKNDDALLSYSAAISRLPQNASIRENRALLLIGMGRYEEAAMDYEELLELFPGNEIYMYKKAICHIGAKNYDAAQRDIDQLQKKDPKSLKATEARAFLATLRGDYTTAEKLYNYLVKKLPENPEVYEGRARMFMLSGQIDLAIHDVNKAIVLSKQNPSPSLMKLKIQMEKKQ